MLPRTLIRNGPVFLRQVSRSEGQPDDALFAFVLHIRFPALSQLLDEPVEGAHELAGKTGAAAERPDLLDDGPERLRIDLRRRDADEFRVALLGEADPPVLLRRSRGGRGLGLGLITGDQRGNCARAQAGGAGGFQEIATFHEQS